MYKNGKVTIPFNYNSILDQIKYYPQKGSKKIKIILPNGFELLGTIFRISNERFTAYQFYPSEKVDRMDWQNHIKEGDVLEFEMDLKHVHKYYMQNEI